MFETMVYDILKEILTYVKKLTFGISTITKVKRFANNQELNLKKMGGENGVRHFTCRNLGQHIMYISFQDEKEPINPGETFTINSPYRTVDEYLKIEFGALHPDYATGITDGIIRYSVDVCN